MNKSTLKARHEIGLENYRALCSISKKLDDALGYALDPKNKERPFDEGEMITLLYKLRLLTSGGAPLCNFEFTE